MMKSLLLVSLIFIASALTFAQNQSPEYDKVEVFAGYSNAAEITEYDDDGRFEHGFNAAAVFNFHRYFGFKFDVSGTYKKVSEDPFNSTRHSFHSVTAGVQIKNNKRSARVKPFAHFLMGYARHSDRVRGACIPGSLCPPLDFDFNGMSAIVGGGLDIRVNRRIDIRVVQFDLNAIGDEDYVYGRTRFSTGIVFKF